MAAPEHLFIHKHHPLIAARIEFQPSPRPALPLISRRVEFNLSQLTAPSLTVAGHERTSDCRATRNTSNSHSSPSTLNRASSREPSTCEKIPKPSGEPDRPGSGGFSLDDTLTDLYDWSREEVERLMKTVREEAKKSSMKGGYRSQSEVRIQGICDKLSDADHWPQLHDYANCWPVRSALKLALKYKAEATKRKKVRTTNERLISAMNLLNTSGGESA